MEGLISILIPTRNEEAYIERCLATVRNFIVPAGVRVEIFVLDGLSKDRTRELVEAAAADDPRVRFVSNPGRIQSTALNLALEFAQGEWIMRLDAHSFYPAEYLERCLETARRTGADNVGGLFITQRGGETYEAGLVQALTTHKFGVGNSGFRTGEGEGPADTVPYGFYRRALFDRVGKLDERLVRAQDYEFNRRVIVAGGRIWRNPRIHVHYHNQPTMRRFLAKQYFMEAPYNAYLWYVAPYAFAWRHAITGVFALGVMGGLVASPISPALRVAFLTVMGLYFALALVAAVQQAVRYREPRHVLFLPFGFFVYHFLHGLGVLVGLSRLATGTAPVQQISEPWPGAGCRRIDPERLSAPGVSRSPSAGEALVGWVDDKAIERDRYERRAIMALAKDGDERLCHDGARSTPLVLRRPYEVFERRIRAAAGPNAEALDVCCGTGLFSIVAAGAGARATASDIAEHNLELARLRAKRAGVPLRTVVADAERLPFPDGSFDLVTCAGSLSYVDLDAFLAEVGRLLRPGGRFICVDSLNHNPIYRLNRWVQYWRGRRSWSTLVRMPTLATISRIRAEIGPGEASFHGYFSFLAVPARLLLGEERAARLLDAADDRLPPLLRPLAFKFVLGVQKARG